MSSKSFGPLLLAIILLAITSRVGGTQQDRRHDAHRAIRDGSCLLCHEATGESKRWLKPVVPPLLDGAGLRLRPEWLIDWIADPAADEPGTRMPHALQSVSVDERRSVATDIAHFLFARERGPAVVEAVQFNGADVDLGRQLFATIGCAACHDGEQMSARMARRTTLPALTGELQQSHAIHRSGRMPQINMEPTEAAAIATYLIRAQATDENGEPIIDVVPGLHYEAYLGTFENCEQMVEQEPVASGYAASISVAPKPRQDNFGLRFSGEFLVSKTGMYQFSLNSDDGSKLWIDGHEVVDNDGIHGPRTRKGQVQLETGWHGIDARIWEHGGGQVIEVRWSGPGIAKEREFRAAELRSRTRVAFPVEAPFRLDPGRIIRGGQAYALHGCNSCHEAKAIPRNKPWSELRAEAVGCLSDTPPLGSPGYPFDDQLKNQIIDLIAGVDPVVAMEGQVHANLLIGDAGCTDCHQRDGRGGPDAEKNKTFIGTAELGDEGRMPPWLTGVGRKLKYEVLHQTIADGLKIRPYVVSRMPSYPPAIAESLAAAIYAADHEPPPEPLIPTFSVESRKVGHQLTGTDGFRCIDCHKFAGHDSLGEPAYDLALMTDRLQPRWFHEYMKDPQSKRPGTRMPTFWFDDLSLFPDLLQGDTDAQVEALWTYLSGGAAAPFPKGLLIQRSDFDLLPTAEEPTMVGVFMRGLSGRVVAVGYPERVSVAYDMENVRLGKAWRGDFINVKGTWVGRAGSLESPAGTDVIDFAPGLPVAIIDQRDSKWPDDPVRDQGWRYRGHRRDAQRKPIFRISGPGGVEMTEMVVPMVAADGIHLRRIFRFEGNQLPRNLAMRFARSKQISAAGDDAWITEEGMTLAVKGLSAAVVEVDGMMELRASVTRAGAEVEVEVRW
ncbi:MAG: c-type cytochrome [Planctomycetota bacterium]|nr:c-type cytochrome [Planctomycetota bacterium]